jgi:sec-independent protein translocase protein TatB
MFGIGMTELLVILAIALIIFGPKRLPELAKQLGKAMREFKKATDEVKENIGLNDLELHDLTSEPPASPEEKSPVPDSKSAAPENDSTASDPSETEKTPREETAESPTVSEKKTTPEPPPSVPHA